MTSKHFGRATVREDVLAPNASLGHVTVEAGSNLDRIAASQTLWFLWGEPVEPEEKFPL